MQHIVRVDYKITVCQRIVSPHPSTKNNMNRFILVSVLLVAVAVSQNTWQKDNFKTSKNTWYTNINNVVTNYCNYTATWEVGNQDHCTISYYLRVEVVDPASSTVPPNNGVAQCTQQDCDKTVVPAEIDCATAFGDKLSQIGK